MAIINPPAWPIDKGEKNALNILLNAFRIAINGALSVFGMVDGFVDEFEDESGVDTSASSNENYDATNDLYKSMETGGGIDSYAKLVLHGDGADGSTTITDSGVTGHTVTPSGNAQIDTAQSLFGGASILFDGSGDYLTVPDHADWDFGTADFTIDFNVRFASVGSFPQTFFSRNGFSEMRLQMDDANTLVLYLMGSEIASRSFTPVINTRYHIEVARSGTNLRIFVNGVQLGATITNSTNVTGTSAILIGQVAGTNFFNGWMEEFRISKGIARHTADFTPPASAYSATTTVLDMTLISEPQTAEVEPKTARIVLFEEDVDAVTLNTDLKAYVSRDDGTTWTQITLADEGDYGSGKRILTGQVGITAQPSGTDMRYKIETDNDKELKLHGVALTWD
jgi:hypothetical protein